MSRVAVCEMRYFLAMMPARASAPSPEAVVTGAAAATLCTLDVGSLAGAPDVAMGASKVTVVLRGVEAARRVAVRVMTSAISMARSSPATHLGTARALPKAESDLVVIETPLT